MPITSETFHRTRERFLGDMLAALQGAISDAYVGEDGIMRIIFTIEAGQFETLSLGNQILLEDMFIQTASFTALRLHGQQYQLALHDGAKSEGSLAFEGASGTYIPIGTRAVNDPGAGIDPIFFQTIEDGLIPSPGAPTAPTVAVGAATGISGDYEYAVAFVTAAGETLQGPDSTIVSVSNQKVNLSNIPLGGAGTISRRIYRQKSGTGSYYRVASINDNTTTTLTGESMSDAVAATQPVAPTTDSAHFLILLAESLLPGSETNVAPGTITALSGAPGALTGVTNQAAFTGGDDTEDTEHFRQRLLDWIRAPQTGSPSDLKVWAEEIQGVESATVFENDNLGASTIGHVTIRVAGPSGGIPDAAVVQAVYDSIKARDIATITIHVGTFTPQSTNVTVDVTTSGTYTLGDVTPGVQQAVANYINNLPVGGTVYLAGIVDAIFGLPGIQDVVVTTPASNQTTAATTKRTIGIVTVT